MNREINGQITATPNEIREFLCADCDSSQLFWILLHLALSNYRFKTGEKALKGHACSCSVSEANECQSLSYVWGKGVVGLLTGLPSS